MSKQIETAGFYTAEQVAGATFVEELMDSPVSMMQEAPDAGWYIGSMLGAQKYAVARGWTAERLGTVRQLQAGELED